MSNRVIDDRAVLGLEVDVEVYDQCDMFRAAAPPPTPSKILCSSSLDDWSLPRLLPVHRPQSLWDAPVSPSPQVFGSGHSRSKGL